MPLVIAIQDPQLVARVLPPLKRRKGVHPWPIMGAIATKLNHICSNNPDGLPRYKVAIKTGIRLLHISMTTENMPIDEPASFHVFAAPGLPSPMILISLLRNNFPIISAQGIYIKSQVSIISIN